MNSRRINSRSQNFSRGHKRPVVPLPRPEEVQNEQFKAISNGFNSSALSYNGSDMVVSVPHGENYKGSWKRQICREFNNQHQMRRFITSCIVDAKKVGYELDALVEELSSPDGIDRIREIVMSPASVDAGEQAKVASFQRVILPFLALLTRSGIIECILDMQVNAIYAVVYNNLDSFINDSVMSMLQELVKRQKISDQLVSQNELLIDDPHAFIPTSLGQFFLVIVRMINEFLKRIKNASYNETIHQIAEKLERLKDEWHESLVQQINSSDLFADIKCREYFFMILNKDIDNMKMMLEKPDNDLSPRKLLSKRVIGSYRNKSILMDLRRIYDPPGELSPNGKRHDNDFSEISKISIIPTREETLCERDPFLPGIDEDDDTHHLPKGSSRLLDRQFRLLREDMLNAFRLSINSFITFLSETDENNAQIQKLKTQGGRYGNNRDLNVYTNVEFSEIVIDKHKGFSCRIAFTPPISKQTARERKAYWGKVRRLMHGNLVCLLWPNEDAYDNGKKTISAKDYSLYFGTVASRNEDMLAEESAKIDINFIDVAIYSIAIKDILSKHSSNKIVKHRFMIESTDLLFESYRSILKTLQEARPENFPFAKYFAPQIDNDMFDEVTKVDSPIYSRAPGFNFDLSVLLKNKNRELLLDFEHLQPENNVIEDLKTYSSLDKTQARALVSALSREVALIEGPPGTGKTYIGVQIMRVLLEKKNRKISKVGPILTITYTNHALDSFLLSLLDHNIKNFVRMGSRSKSETIGEYQIDAICSRNKDQRLRSLLGRSYSELEKIEEKAKKITERQTLRWIDWNLPSVTSYLMDEFPEHYKNLQNPNIPEALLLIDRIEESRLNDEDGKKGDGVWKKVGSSKRKASIFEQWVRGLDLQEAQMLQQKLQNKLKNKEYFHENKYEPLSGVSEKEEDALDIYDYIDEKDHKFLNWLSSWRMPKSTRSLDELKDVYDVWNMSKAERVILHDFWREELHSESVKELARIRKSHDKIRGEIEKIYNEKRRNILSKCDVIGVTTSGAAKHHDLIRSIAPKIIICEEAGEVLEAHILSSLTPSIQQIILIGDHNQLRPKICNYRDYLLLFWLYHDLSIDSDIGKNYDLDVSLFERLVHGKNSCTKVEATQLLTQRRMRREIADLVRNTIYPDLEDHDETLLYPNVHGVQSNVFFIDHQNPEDPMRSEFALQSHSNEFEVKMIVEMVKYFVRNGYTKAEQIAVLTPYLGQLLKIRDALASSFMVVIDERDSDDLVKFQDQMKDNDQQEPSPKAEKMSTASKRRLNQQVVLRTIDNFQGEEADIVIISLVRNITNKNYGGSIGFLKSRNRTNVLLSRARHGMYLIGNAKLMKNKSEIWADVINILESRQPPQIGPGFPIVCARHPNHKNIITDPKKFGEISPDGGCTLSCGRALNCGHICPYKCHPDDPNHISIFCKKECNRLHECGHPCKRLCGEKCGECNFPVGDIELPCGHILENACHKPINYVKCRENCGFQIPECGHPCKSDCCECQDESIKANGGRAQIDENGYVKRTNHQGCKQDCARNQFCGHV
ncbi:11716_t:CDS:10, partial [Acaulospora morrowiae]